MGVVLDSEKIESSGGKSNAANIDRKFACGPKGGYAGKNFVVTKGVVKLNGYFWDL